MFCTRVLTCIAIFGRSYYGCYPATRVLLHPGSYLFNPSGILSENFNDSLSLGAPSRHRQASVPSEPLDSAGPEPIPAVISIFNHSRSFLGTMSVAKYLNRPCKGGLPACITQEGRSDLLKPSEAEERAGQGSCKSWKTTFRTFLHGKVVTLQEYLSAHRVK